MNYYALVGNGDKDEGMCDEIRSASIVIGVDRGALWLLEHGIVPAIAVGDFDSVSQKEMERIKTECADVRVYPAEKDKADMELAIDVAQSLYPKGEARIFGALGKRIDHTLGNIGLLEHCYVIGMPAEVVDEQSRIRYIKTIHTIKRDKRYPYLSVIPVGKSASVTMQGVQYPVDHKIFYRSSTLGISNRIISAEAVIMVHKGSVLIINSRD